MLVIHRDPVLSLRTSAFWGGVNLSSDTRNTHACPDVAYIGQIRSIHMFKDHMNRDLLAPRAHALFLAAAGAGVRSVDSARRGINPRAALRDA